MNKTSRERAPERGPFLLGHDPQQAPAYIGTMAKEAVGRLIAALLVLGSAACDASTGDTSMPVSEPTIVAFEDILTGPPIAVPQNAEERVLRSCRPRKVADALQRFLTTAAEGSREQIADSLTRPFSWIAFEGEPWFPDNESYESIAGGHRLSGLQTETL